MEIRFLGHSTFELTHDGVTLLIDPFLTGNPKAAATADEVSADAILVTHGHGDHIGDTVAIAKRTGAHAVAIVEIAGELREDGLESVSDPNLGGTVEFRLGQRQAGPGMAYLDDAEGDCQHAGGTDRPVRRLDDLPPRRHCAVRRSGADRPPPRDRRRADADRRPLHDGSPRCGRSRADDRRPAR